MHSKFSGAFWFDKKQTRLKKYKIFRKITWESKDADVYLSNFFP